MTRLFSISEDKRGDFESKMNRFINKAKKLNIPFGYKLESESRVKIVERVTGFDYYQTVFNYSVYGESPTINGYTFLAKLESFGDGNLIHSHNTEYDFKNYRSCELTCQHCNIKRERNFYFLIIDANNNVKMLGGNCLANYINLPNAEDIANFYSGITDLIQTESESDDEPKSKNEKSLYKIESFLPYAIQSINEFGYHKTDSIRPTKYNALNRIGGVVTDEEKTESNKILSYITEYLRNKLNNAQNNNMFGISEYEITLLKLLENGYMLDSHAGYIVSIIPLYNKLIEKDIIKKSQPESNHIGAAGDKINVNAIVTRYNKIENNFNGHTHIYNFISDGNVIVYFSSKSFDIELNDNVNITGTIKKLDSFNGINQTIITRSKVNKI